MNNRCQILHYYLMHTNILKLDLEVLHKSKLRLKADLKKKRKVQTVLEVFTVLVFVFSYLVVSTDTKQIILYFFFYYFF